MVDAVQLGLVPQGHRDGERRVRARIRTGVGTRAVDRQPLVPQQAREHRGEPVGAGQGDALGLYRTEDLVGLGGPPRDERVEPQIRHRLDTLARREQHPHRRELFDVRRQQLDVGRRYLFPDRHGSEELRQDISDDFTQRLLLLVRNSENELARAGEEFEASFSQSPQFDIGGADGNHFRWLRSIHVFESSAGPPVIRYVFP